MCVSCEQVPRVVSLSCMTDSKDTFPVSKKQLSSLSGHQVNTFSHTFNLTLQSLNEEPGSLLFHIFCMCAGDRLRM